MQKLSRKELFLTSIAILIIGVGAGFFSYFLHICLKGVVAVLGTNQKFDWITLGLAFVLVTISYMLTKFLFTDTGGSGIPQVKLALVALKGRMPKRMPFGKFLTTLTTLSSGMSFGIEGPMVSISAAWAHLTSHILNLGRQVTKVMVTAGATAGLSAAFNTPIAAVVFTVEEILGQLNTRYLAPIIIVSVIASVTSYKLFGGHTTFVNINHVLYHEWHLLLYLILGVFMAFIGFFWEKSVLFFKECRSRYFIKTELIYIYLVLVLVALASHLSPELLGSGVSTINRLLQSFGNLDIKLLFLLFALKFILAALCYSSGLSGGLFMPVLFIGASGGAMFALGLQLVGIENVQIGAFALIGMTSLLVAIIRIPFTAFVMMFEMTRDYEMILPLMVSSIVAYLISSLICNESIYELVAEYEGVHLPNASENETLNELTVEDCMVKKPKTFSPIDRIENIIEDLSKDKYGGYPVVLNRKFIGMINTDEAMNKYEQNPDLSVENVMRRSVIKIYPDQPVMVAFDKMQRFEIGRLPVVSRFNDKTLLGLITPEDIVNAISLHKE